MTAEAATEARNREPRQGVPPDDNLIAVASIYLLAPNLYTRTGGGDGNDDCDKDTDRGMACALLFPTGWGKAFGCPMPFLRIEASIGDLNP
ncbi:hypothetical protein MUK42_19526 [Musa troglodytarum]|uniref:Uncharacterized protein n=1 Tax=Musa troglodytarum TaxID=320322 RepID=A0A9E7GFH4_9LILI|nr:hypothetical protein MUK42_19526 [Musa troglodytarum]